MGEETSGILTEIRFETRLAGVDLGRDDVALGRLEQDVVERQAKGGERLGYSSGGHTVAPLGWLLGLRHEVPFTLFGFDPMLTMRGAMVRDLALPAGALGWPDTCRIRAQRLAGQRVAARAGAAAARSAGRGRAGRGSRSSRRPCRRGRAAPPEQVAVLAQPAPLSLNHSTVSASSTSLQM